MASHDGRVDSFRVAKKHRSLMGGTSACRVLGKGTPARTHEDPECIRRGRDGGGGPPSHGHTLLAALRHDPDVAQKAIWRWDGAKTTKVTTLPDQVATMTGLSIVGLTDTTVLVSNGFEGTVLVPLDGGAGSTIDGALLEIVR